MKLKKKQDSYCGKSEYIVICKKCGIRHYHGRYELQIFETIGYYICGSCAEQMRDYKLVKDEHYQFLYDSTKAHIKNQEDECSRYGNDYIVGDFIDEQEKKLKEIEELYEE